jgi:UDP-2,3-diacylglucosamine hydrolase
VSGGPAPALRIAPGEPVLFASDMHLSPECPRTAQVFLDALDRHGPSAAHLFLLGDLFEVWVGDDGADALAEALAERLWALSRRGTRVWMMRGNRDFLIDVPLPDSTRPPFSSRCGATRLDDPCPVALHGVRALLSHGDALCTDDRVYQQWRLTCREPRWQQAMLSRPLAERLVLGRSARDHSEAGKREAPDALMDVNPDAVDAAMDAAGATLLIHGHTHRPATHRWMRDAMARTRVVLTDWDAERGRGALLRWAQGSPQWLSADGSTA